LGDGAYKSLSGPIPAFPSSRNRRLPLACISSPGFISPSDFISPPALGSGAGGESPSPAGHCPTQDRADSALRISSSAARKRRARNGVRLVRVISHAWRPVRLGKQPFAAPDLVMAVAIGAVDVPPIIRRTFPTDKGVIGPVIAPVVTNLFDRQCWRREAVHPRRGVASAWPEPANRNTANAAETAKTIYLGTLVRR
jgi:hypothetical protein